MFEKLIEMTREITTYDSIFRVLTWDQETFMPKGAIDVRSHQLAELSHHIHQLKTSKAFKEELEKHVDLKTGEVKQEKLSFEEKRMLREWRRSYLKEIKLPPRFIKELVQTSSKAVSAWAKARNEDDFSFFSPHLKKIIELNLEKAEILGYEDHPYDALIDSFEPGMTTAKLKELFKELKVELVKILEQAQKRNVDDTLIETPYPKDQQRKLGQALLKRLNLDPRYSRMDESTHPFSIGIHPHDTRITTRIEDKRFLSNLFSILHECGHAFYEMGLDPKFEGTSLFNTTSLGIHESQSRWWETRIGRSLSFWKHFYPEVQRELDVFSKIPLDDFYQMMHAVKPSYIRVEADEVTYCLHIILRFEIECLFMEGTLSVEQLPDVWNKKTEELLRITPPNFKLGCLQDIHWSMGELGYFPTYALGNIYASQFFEVFEKQCPDYEEKLEKGEMDFIREWLRKNIHSQGSLYRPEELVEKVTGKTLHVKPYIDYLQSKYMMVST